MLLHQLRSHNNDQPCGRLIEIRSQHYSVTLLTTFLGAQSMVDGLVLVGITPPCILWIHFRKIFDHFCIKLLGRGAYNTLSYSTCQNCLFTIKLHHLHRPKVTELSLFSGESKKSCHLLWKVNIFRFDILLTRRGRPR